MVSIRKTDSGFEVTFPPPTDPSGRSYRDWAPEDVFSFSLKTNESLVINPFSFKFTVVPDATVVTVHEGKQGGEE